MVTYSRSPWRCRSSLWKEMEQSGALVLTLPESQAAENPTLMKAAWATGQHPWAVRKPEAGPALGFLSRKLSQLVPPEASEHPSLWSSIPEPGPSHLPRGASILSCVLIWRSMADSISKSTDCSMFNLQKSRAQHPH